MEFDFLPNKPPPPPPPVSDNYFIDTYKNHLDAHNLFSTPTKRNEWNLEYNFKQILDRYFPEDLIKSRLYSFYGNKTSYEKLLEGYTTFQDIELLKNTLDVINQEINTDMFSEIEKNKLNINDRFGIFSFDLASMAMTYVFEYFTKSGKKVDANFVEKKGNKYYKVNSKIEVFQKIKRRKNSTPVVISSVRKCFVDFEKQKSKDKSVEILVNSSFAGSEQVDNLIYNCMAAIAVAKNLLLKGFKVKITSVLCVNEGKKKYFHLVPVKSFDQPLDINAAAYVCGDPRFFRYQGFKMIAKGYDIHNNKIAGGLGIPVRDNKTLRDAIEKDYVPYSNLQQADTRLYFGGSRSLRQSKREVENAIALLNEKYSNNEKN